LPLSKSLSCDREARAQSGKGCDLLEQLARALVLALPPLVISFAALFILLDEMLEVPDRVLAG